MSAILFILLSVAGVTVSVVGRERLRNRRRRQAWDELARRRGATLQRSDSDWALWMEVLADDALILVETTVNSVLVRALYVVGAGPVIAGQHVLLAGTPGVVTSDGRGVSFCLDELDVAPLDPAIDTVAKLARTGMECIDAMRRLPGARYRPPTGKWDARTMPEVVVTVPGGVAEVTLASAVEDGRPVARATAVCGRELPPFEWVLGWPNAPPPVVAAGIEARVAAAGAARLSCDGTRLALTWEQLVTDEAELLAGAGIVAALAAAPAQGAYR